MVFDIFPKEFFKGHFPRDYFLRGNFPKVRLGLLRHSNVKRPRAVTRKE